MARCFACRGKGEVWNIFDRKYEWCDNCSGGHEEPKLFKNVNNPVFRGVKCHSCGQAVNRLSNDYQCSDCQSRASRNIASFLGKD